MKNEIFIDIEYLFWLVDQYAQRDYYLEAEELKNRAELVKYHYENCEYQSAKKVVNETLDYLAKKCPSIF